MICRRFITLFAAMVLSMMLGYAQFLHGGSGLLQTPVAEMNPSGTFMITNCFMNAHTLPEEAWGYHSFGYGFDITFLSRIEVYYTCVILDGKRKPNPTSRDTIMFNQDRHVGVKVQLLRTGDFGWDWAPDIAVGVNDLDFNMFSRTDASNGFFTSYYAMASKSFRSQIGTWNAHLGFQFNNRTYYSHFGPCAAVDWQPVWLQKEDLINTSFIVEYDARTLNIGAVVSFWRDHFEAMIDFQSLRWLSVGLRYKVVLK